MIERLFCRINPGRYNGDTRGIPPSFALETRIYKGLKPMIGGDPLNPQIKQGGSPGANGS